MTTVRIKQEFRDKDRFSKIYPVGSICEFEDGRAKELISRGLVEAVSTDSIETRPKRGRRTFDE